MNANNNTYWCVRTLNTTHNSLYCEFITGFVTYYDMRIDPYQLRNIAHTLTETQLAFFHQTLEKLRVCRGADCFVNTHPSSAAKLAAAAVSQRQQAQDSSSYHLQSSSHLLLDINRYILFPRDVYFFTVLFIHLARLKSFSTVLLLLWLFFFVVAAVARLVVVRPKCRRADGETVIGADRRGARGGNNKNH